MTDHQHDIRMQWPFQDAENTATYSCGHVTEAGHPILRVAHDEEDGAWQFLCGQPHVSEEGRLVCLGCVVGRDRTLLELADLPLGWCAESESRNSSWIREPNPGDESG
jgi:hypothetical protein